MGAASPIFRRLGLTRDGLEWVLCTARAGASPGRWPRGGAVAGQSDGERTCESLGADGRSWVRLLEPFVERREDFFSGILRPVRVPRHPWLMARFGRFGLMSSDRVARRFAGDAARALLAGSAAHSCLAFDAPGSAAHRAGPGGRGTRGRLALRARRLAGDCQRAGRSRPIRRVRDPDRCARSIVARHPRFARRAARRHAASASCDGCRRPDRAVSPPAPALQVRSRGVQDRLRVVREDSLALRAGARTRRRSTWAEATRRSRDPRRTPTPAASPTSRSYSSRSRVTVDDGPRAWPAAIRAGPTATCPTDRPST